MLLHRSLLALADCSFAFMHAPSILLPLQRVIDIPIGPLMRHVPLRPQWSVDGWLLHRDMDRLLKRDLWIADLDTTLDGPGSSIWRRLLDNPRVHARLRSLRFHSDGASEFSTELSRIIGRMPHLTRLALKIDQHWISPDMIGLVRAPRITSLQIEHAIRPVDLPALLQTPRALIHLGLGWPTASSSASVDLSSDAPTPLSFRSFFTSDALLQLRSLFLLEIAGSALDCACASRDDLVAVFSALSRLQLLHVRSSPGVSALLPHLVHARALDCVTVESRNASELASMQVWSMLLAARPQVRGVALLDRGVEHALEARPRIPPWAQDYAASKPIEIEMRMMIKIPASGDESNRPSAAC